MKKFLTFLLLFGLLGTLLIGCTTNDEQPVEKSLTKEVTLFYGDEGNEDFVTETRIINYKESEDLYKIVLEELIKGPATEGYRNNINQETKVYETTIQDNDIIVNFSKEFNQFGGSIAEIIGVGAVVNTLTQFDDIKRVKILVEGEELIGPSGNPRGFMEPFKKENDVSSPNNEVILYFGNKDATKVAAEKRIINQDANISRNDFLKSVLEELIKGPTNVELSRTIPEEVQVLSVRVENKIAYVDFSEEMHTKHWHGAAGEWMTIASVVSTLTEFEDIEKVMMTVAGQPMFIEHIIVEEPIGRNEDMIEQ